MWNRQDLKEKGKAAFRANYWQNVLVAFILGLLTAGTSYFSSNSTQNKVNPSSGAINVTVNGQPVHLDNATIGIIAAAVAAVALVAIAVAVVLDIFLFNPLEVGCYAFFKQNVEKGESDLNLLKVGFGDYKRIFVAMFLRGLYIFLWGLLLIVPGVVKAYSYRMVPFIVRDNPELSGSEVLRKSSEMMYGNRKDAFVLDLSFLGWAILSLVTLGLVGVFWSNPYYQNTNAALYLALCGENTEEIREANTEDNSEEIIIETNIEESI